ncbi:MAG TPA: prepilin-type N-terminal cleavage/methylation domain-containing protein [Dissulfurispiraceae bacterium]|nr:prepilin-type N-terminal cleavage/methylation domain-containing protein [Dissulfurispiraceae bacterium]
MKRTENQSGFTLMEMMIVLFIIALTAGIVGVSFTRALPSSRLDATVREMAAAFKQLRAQAMITGERRVLVYNLDARQYGPEGQAARQWPDDVTVTITDPVQGDAVRGEYRFVFHATGASEGGTVVLSTAKKTMLLGVDPIVGAIALRVKE